MGGQTNIRSGISPKRIGKAGHAKSTGTVEKKT